MNNFNHSKKEEQFNDPSMCNAMSRTLSECDIEEFFKQSMAADDVVFGNDHDRKSYVADGCSPDLAVHYRNLV